MHAPAAVHFTECSTPLARACVASCGARGETDPASEASLTSVLEIVRESKNCREALRHKVARGAVDFLRVEWVRIHSEVPVNVRVRQFLLPQETTSCCGADDGVFWSARATDSS